MNPAQYAEEAVTIKPASPTPWLPNTTGVFALVLRFGYPTPGAGAELFHGPRGRVNGTLDVPADQLRDFLAQTIESVAEDCISVVDSLDIDYHAKSRVAEAIRQHFELAAH